MSILNLTPHKICVCDDDGNVINEYKPSDYVVRLSSKQQVEITDLSKKYGFPIFTPQVFLEPIGMPPLDVLEKYDAIIVSIFLAQYFEDNQEIDFNFDVFAPDTGPSSAVRGKKGEPDEGELKGVKRFNVHYQRRKTLKRKDSQ